MKNVIRKVFKKPTNNDRRQMFDPKKHYMPPTTFYNMMNEVLKQAVEDVNNGATVRLKGIGQIRVIKNKDKKKISLHNQWTV